MNAAKHHYRTATRIVYVLAMIFLVLPQFLGILKMVQTLKTKDPTILIELDFSGRI